jgi:dihydropteroate synthase
MANSSGASGPATFSGPLLWRSTRFDIDLRTPQVMGIVNVTPDSFSDGGRFFDTDAALRHCEQLVAEGADILDIGGESTRPGAAKPSADDEATRVLPVLRHALTLGVPVSLDSSEPRVMQAALDMGVDIVNDVRALRRPGALQALAAHPRAGVCLMHMRGEPGNMDTETTYTDVVAEVRDWLATRLAEVVAAGVATERVLLDPGIGFAKSREQDLALLHRQAELQAIGRPLLVGWSRKRTLGLLTGRPVAERQAASVAAAIAAVARGAVVVRVHDVAATVDALRVWQAAATGAAASRTSSHKPASG